MSPTALGAHNHFQLTLSDTPGWQTEQGDPKKTNRRRSRASRPVSDGTIASHPGPISIIQSLHRRMEKGEEPHLRMSQKDQEPPVISVSITLNRRLTVARRNAAAQAFSSTRLCAPSPRNGSCSCSCSGSCLGGRIPALFAHCCFCSDVLTQGRTTSIILDSKWGPPLILPKSKRLREQVECLVSCLLHGKEIVTSVQWVHAFCRLRAGLLEFPPNGVADNAKMGLSESHQEFQKLQP